MRRYWLSYLMGQARALGRLDDFQHHASLVLEQDDATGGGSAFWLALWVVQAQDAYHRGERPSVRIAE